MWKCRCSCGVECEAAGVYMRNGNTRSCGCLMREISGTINRTHGAARGDESQRSGAYRSWRSMRARCAALTNPDYGGRDISVCDRWADFEKFLEDMGERPEGHSLERRDVNGHYEPANCLWIPLSEQAANQRKTVRWTINGEVVIQAEAARRLGVHPSTLLRWHRKPEAMPETLRHCLRLTENAP